MESLLGVCNLLVQVYRILLKFTHNADDTPAVNGSEPETPWHNLVLWAIQVRLVDCDGAVDARAISWQC